MKPTPLCLTLLLASILLGTSCQSPSDPAKPRLSYLDLSRTRVPNQPQHPLFPGVTLSADQITASATGEQEFTGHIFCDSTEQKKAIVESGAQDIGWPLYATAKEATWNPASQTLELRGRPAIQFAGSIVETLEEDGVITLSPLKVNILGQSKSTLLSQP
ncbi:MAG: hypothetical protein QE274_04055 [Verrucomicrobiaceae bacterium]|jgi:hypothetical protein|nr:hypothetical protein [Verrucomicrobiaceae bacterium]